MRDRSTSNAIAFSEDTVAQPGNYKNGIFDFLGQILGFLKAGHITACQFHIS